MILHIMKKDWKLLWRVVLLVAATQFALALMLFHIDHAAVDKNPYGLLLQLVLFMTFLSRAVLIVMCVQQDSIPGDRQDWLTRPVKRFDLMFAKLAFVLLFAQGPVLIADFLQAFAGGASFWHSLSAAITRSLFVLPIFTLPFVAFGALTRNLTEAIAGAVIFFLLLSGGEMLFVGLSEGRRILEVSPTTLTGLAWITDGLRLLVVSDSRCRLATAITAPPPQHVPALIARLAVGAHRIATSSTSLARATPQRSRAEVHDTPEWRQLGWRILSSGLMATGIYSAYPARPVQSP